MSTPFSPGHAVFLTTSPPTLGGSKGVKLVLDVSHIPCSRVGRERQKAGLTQQGPDFCKAREVSSTLWIPGKHQFYCQAGRSSFPGLSVHIASA